jgi:hypothetical protein
VRNYPNSEQIKKIDVISVEMINPGLIAINTEERSYIYDIFRKNNKDNLQNDIQYPGQDNTKTLLELVFSKLKGVSSNKKPGENEQGNTFWDIAEAGISGFNKITGNDLSIEREYDNNGKIIALAFKSDGFEIYRRRGVK